MSSELVDKIEVVLDVILLREAREKIVNVNKYIIKKYQLGSEVLFHRKIH